MNKLSTKNQNLLTGWMKSILLMISLFCSNGVLQAQIPACNPIMNGCLSQGNNTLNTQLLNASCQYTYPDLVSFHAWTAAAVCFDGVNNWTRIGVPFVAQIPPAGTGPLGLGGASACSNFNLNVDIFATYLLGINTTCTILKGDFFAVTDIQAPTLGLPPNVTFDVDNGCNVLASTVLAWAKANAMVADNCTNAATLINNIVIVSNGIVNLACPTSPGPGGPVTFTTMDACGNVSSPPTTVNVSLRDNVAPTITCPAPQARNWNNVCQYQIQDFRGLGTTSSTGCGTPNTVIQRVIAPFIGTADDFGATVSAAGTCPSTRSFTIRLCARDCFGNGGDPGADNSVPAQCCTFILTVTDNIPPIPNPGACPPQIVVNADANCSITVPDRRVAGLFTDNCDPITVANIVQIPAPGSTLAVSPVCSPGKPIDVSFTYTDCNGNGPASLTCPASILARDVTPPTITCPTIAPVVNLSLDPVSCTYTSATIPANFFANLSIARDNCDPAPVITSAAAGPFDCSQLGLKPVSVTATDCSGNSVTTTCNVLIQVNPNDAYWNPAGIVCLSQVPLNLCNLIPAVAGGPESIDLNHSPGAGGGISGNPRIGNSFFPMLNGYTTGFDLFNNGTVGTRTFNIHSGAGFGGPVLYSTSITMVPGTNHISIPFATALNLIPGNTYTWELTGGAFNLVFNNGSYGQIFDFSGPIFPGIHVAFNTYVTILGNLCGTWSGDSVETNKRCTNGPVLFKPDRPGVYAVTYTVGDANCHVEFTRAITVESDPPVTSWFISNISKCLCPGAYIDFETFFKASDSIPHGGTWTFVASGPQIVQHAPVASSHSATYGGGCGTVTLTYSIKKCDGTTVSQTYVLTIRECAKGYFDAPDDFCQDEAIFRINNPGLTYGARGCSDYNVNFSVPAGPAGNALISGPVNYNLGNPVAVNINPKVTAGIYTIRMIISDPTGVCAPDTALQVVRIYKDGFSPNGINALGPLCENVAFPQILSLINTNDEAGNPLLDADVRWTGSGVTDAGVTASFNPPDLDGDGLPGPGLFTVCVELGDARCTDQYCRDVLINDDIPAIANDLVPSFSICATTNIFIPYDALRANGSMSGGLFVPVISPTITGISLPNGYFYTGGCGTIALTYTIPGDCNPDAINNTTTITIAPKPDVEISGAQSVCITDAPYTISSNIPNGGLLNCPNTTGMPWTISPNRGLTVGTTTATFNPAVAGEGTFTVTYVYATAAGCADTSRLTIVVSAASDPTFNVTSPLCQAGPNLTISLLNPNPSVQDGNILNGDNFQEVIWSASCGACIAPVTPDSTMAVFNPTTAGPGIHLVCVTTGDPSCMKNYCQLIRVVPTVVPTLRADTIRGCYLFAEGSPVELDLEQFFLANTTRGGTWTYISGPGVGVLNHTLRAFPGCHQVRYTVTGELPTGPCSTMTDDIFIIITEQPQPYFAIQDQVCWSAGDPPANHIYTPFIQSQNYFPGGTLARTFFIKSGTNGSVNANTGVVTITGAGTLQVCMEERLTYAGCGTVATASCKDTFCQNIIVSNGTALNASFSVSNSNPCAGDVVILTSTGTPGGQFTGVGVVDGGNGTTGTFTPNGCGTFAVTYTVDDPNGCNAVFTMNITTDRTRPTVTPPANITVNCDGSGNLADMTAWAALATATDNCPAGLKLTNRIYDRRSGCGRFAGTYVFEFKAEDSCRNQTFAYANFTVQDTTRPTITTPASDLVIECGNITPTLILSWLNDNGRARASDICAGNRLTWSHNYSGNIANYCSNLGEPVIFTVKDECGNTNTTTARIIVRDQVAPVWIINPVNIRLECNGAQGRDPYGAVTSWLNKVGDGVAIDSCQTSVIFTNNFAALPWTGGCNRNTGSKTVTFTAADACGNLATRQATVTIIDTTRPFISSPAKDTVVDCDGNGNVAALNTWLTNNGGARAIDDCSGTATIPGILRWNQTVMRTLEGCGLTREITYMFSAVDSCNNVSANTIARFIIQDTMAPMFVVNPQNTTVSCNKATGDSVELKAWLAINGGATAVDVCAGGPLRWESNLVRTLDLCSNTTVYTYRFTVFDSCRNSAWREALFTVNDVVAPVIDPASGYNKITSCELLNAGNTDQLTAWLDSFGGLRATDACSDIINWRHNFSDTKWVYGCGKTRSQAVTFTATDDCGNASNRTLTIATTDIVKPVFLNCPPPIVQDAEFGHCDAYVTVPKLVATDNCSDPVTITLIYGPDPIGFRFPVGTTILKYEARDACNNRDTCTIKVVVNDYWDVPAIVCPGNIDTTNSTGVCGRNALSGLAPKSVTDVCPHTAVTYVIKNSVGDTIKKGINDASGSNFPKGLNQVCYNVQDQPIVLITEVTQQIDAVVVGSTNPLPAFISPADVNGDYVEITNFGPSAIDISCSSLQVFEGGRLLGTFTLPAMPALILPVGRVLVFHVGPAIAGFPDNPGQFFFNMNLPETTIGTPRGYVFNHLGLRNVDVVGTNGYNFAAPVQGLPTITAADWSGVSPTNVSAGSYYRNCIFDFNSPRGWALAEACEPASIGRVNPVLAPFVFPANGRTTSMQTINAQKATCCFNVNIRDVEPPMCANAKDTLNLIGGTGAQSGPGCYSFTVVAPASPITKIGEVWVRNLNMTVTNFAQTEVTLVSPDGTRVRLWDDGTCSGSTNFVSTRISDLDNVKVANANCAVLNSGQNYKPDQALMAFCNKPAAGQWRLEIEMNSPAPSNLTLSSWTLTLINSGASNLRDTIISNTPNLCGANFTLTHPTVMDNCCMGSVDVTYTAIPMPGCPLQTVPTGGRVIAGGTETLFFGVGMTNITYLITDMSGNTNTCSYKLTVRDDQAPVIINCSKDYTANLAGGECFKFFEVNPPIDARDNCDSIRYVYNPPLGTKLPVGANKVTVTAIDKAGNQAMCMWTITVVESNPTSRPLACNDLINFSLGPDCRGVLTADMILEGNGYGCYDRYLITIEDWITKANHVNLFTINDVNRYFKVTITDPITGNKCWGKVLVEYKAIPQIACPSDITVECNNSLDPEQTGNISVLSCVLNYTTVWEDSIIKGKNCDTPFVFIVKRKFTVTNELGNEVSCTQNIYVRAFDLNKIVWPRHYDNLDLPALNCDQKIDRNKDVTPHMADYPLCVDGYLLDSAYWLARPNQPDIYPNRRIPMILGWNCIDAQGDPAFGHPNPDPVYFPAHRQWTAANPLCWGPNERVEWRGTGWPTLAGIPVRKDAYNCNLSMKYDDEVYDICANSYEILRHWKVRNMCLPPLAGVNPIEYLQVIKVLDQKGPEVNYPDTVVIGTGSYNCSAIWEVPKPSITDNCADSVSYTVKSLTGNPVKQTDGSWIIFNMKPGISKVTVTAQDLCGNKTEKIIHANVIDNTPPTVICRARTTVSITGNQSPGENLAKLWAESLDEGTYDNCQPHVYFKVIRMSELLGTNNGSNANNVGSCSGINGDDNSILAGNQVYFDDFTYFCCADAGNKIMVVLRAFDVDPGAGPITPARMTNATSPLRGRFSDCMVEVEVQNKTIPTVVAPPNIVVSCSFWFDINLLTNPNDATFGRVVTDLSDRHKVVTQDIVCHKFCERNVRTGYPGYVQTNTVPKPAPNQACEYYFANFDTAHWDRKYELVWGFDGYVLSGCGSNPNISVNDLRECGQGQIQRVISAVGPNNLNVSAIQTIWVVDCDPFYVDTNTCNDARFTDLFWPNGVCTQTPVTVDGCGGDISPENPQLGKPTVINNADDNCALISIEHRDEIFTIEPDACFKILRTWIVIDWCQYDPFIDPNFGRWEALQVIKVRDRNKPVVTCHVGDCQPATLANGVCYGPISLTAEATDNCSPEDWLSWEYKIDINNDGKGIHGGYDYRVGTLTKQGYNRGDTVEYSHNPYANDRHNPFDASGTYPVGTHKICWFVEDGCGNVGTCCSIFEIKDCKAPTPYCLTGIISVPMPATGCITIWAKDLDHGSFDNCTAQENLKFYFDGDPNKPSITICCQDFIDKKVNDELLVDVEMWVEDEEGNKDYCKTRVIIQDNLDICPNNGSAKGKIVGNLMSEKNEEAGSIDVYLFNNQNMMSQKVGSPYQFTDLDLSLNYTVKPERNDNHLNGVSTQDIVMIQKHILGKTLISSPYRLIAADVNNSGSVTTADISEIRKLILGINTEFTKVKSWTFVSNDYKFADPTIPFSAPRTADVKFNQTQVSETSTSSFMAIKMGDVSLDASANGVATKTRTSGALHLEIDEQQLVAGQSYAIAFKASDFANIAGYQFTLRFDPNVLVMDGLESGVLNTTEANFGLMKLNEGIITTSWNSNKGESFDKDAKLFIVKFKALKSGSLSKLLAITNDITSVQAYTESNVVMDIKLGVRTQSGIVETGIFDLYQNEPNPVSKFTSISFRLADASDAKLTIYEPNGKVLRVYNIKGQKGLNKLDIKSEELSSSSEILFYQLDADKNSATKKMILIK